MTTAVTRPYTVTARINTPAPATDTPATIDAPATDTPATVGTPATATDAPAAAAAPAAVDAVDSAPAVYTATVYMNTDRDNFSGYQHHHPLAEATRRDGSPLRLVFHASERITDHEAAADAAFTVGNDQGPDNTGQTWPVNLRSVSVGDVIKITGPDHWIVYLSVDRVGFSAVPEPATLTNRITLNAEHAADVAHALFEEIRRAAQEKASDDFDDYDLMLKVNDMAPYDALATLADANLPSYRTRFIAAALALLAPDSYAPRANGTSADGTN